ncbi:mucin-13 [Trichosurus vulpecula]|uniref:mucin-13 n=1 Tax=Trichosurus vulpecula TaxID=9337 RepID=UPI00186B000C|nr:mucin-13 [Trichosurus vulpecula]
MVLDETCTEETCHGSSICVSLSTKSFCVCPEGYYYNDSDCNQGRTFPGIITLLWELSGLDDKTSVNYQNLHFTIVDLIGSAFANDPTFGQAVILSLQTFEAARSEMRSEGQVSVTVTSIFSKSSTITLEEVSKAIKNEAEKEGFSYEEENPCELSGCKNTSEDCSDGFQCECKTGLARPYPLSFCSVCSSDCNKKANKQCIKDPDNLLPECQCLPDYTTTKEGTCQKCAFGYSGVGCKDNYILIFTVVCVIIVALLVASVIGLIVLFRSNRRKKNGEEDSLISRDFNDMRLETTGFGKPASSTGSLFPKVKPRIPRIQSNEKSNPYADLNFPRSMPARDY